MKRCYIAYSREESEKDALAEVLSEFCEDGELIEPILIIFSSDQKKFAWFSKSITNAFPNATVIGTTSLHMYSSLGMSSSGIAAMAITSGITVSAGVLFEISRFPKRYASAISNALEKIDDISDTCCLEFNASSEKCEEMVMDTFFGVLKGMSIPVVGATAGKDSGNVYPSNVSLNGVVYVDACVFAFIHNLEGKIRVIKENIFRPTKHFFVATDTDCDERIVYEYDHKPAAVAVAAALDIPVDEFSKDIFEHSMGRKGINNQLYITSIEKVNKDLSISYYSKIYNQTKVLLMEPKENIFEVWRETASKLKRVMRDPSFSIVLNCTARVLYFDEIGINDEFQRALSRYYGNFIGGAFMGEQMNYSHLNQTMILVAFE